MVELVRHDVEIVDYDAAHGKTKSPLRRWKCSCGRSSESIWYLNAEEAMKRAEAHVNKQKVGFNAH